MKKISIFGVTGSVGKSTAEVILSQPGCFSVGAVTAHRDVDGLVRAANALNASCAVIADETLYGDLKDRLAGTGIKAMAGRAALDEAAEMDCELMVAAISGFTGLESVMAAIRRGTNIALANKEPLVAAGEIVVQAASDSGAKLLPLDSEHNAIFQVFEEAQRGAIKRIILTASGGPFRDWTLEQMELATPEQAVAHPNWDMGRKISVDSATLMNKALEVVEAHYLFNMHADQIDVVIHPQSIVHSMVEYVDGSVLAQMGAPDMKTPIAYCLGWPARIPTPGQTLSFNQKMNLDFEPVDKNKFIAVQLAYQALAAGPAHCAAFNAANEVAVASFLEKTIRFTDIVKIVDHILDKTDSLSLKSVADAAAFDKTVRERTKAYIDNNIQKEVYAA